MKAGRFDPSRVRLGRGRQRCLFLLQRLGTIPVPEPDGKGGIWALPGRFSAGPRTPSDPRKP